MLSVNCLLFRKDNYIRIFVKCLSKKYFVKPRGPTAMLLSNVPTSGFSPWPDEQEVTEYSSVLRIEIQLVRCFGCLSGPPGFTCWISFAPVFSLIYC